LAPGSRLPSRTLLGLGPVVTKSFTEEGQLIAGVPAHIVRPLDPEDFDLLYDKTRRDLPDVAGVDVPAGSQEG
jgi:hypothetical protein